jgi:hypothetical protein
MLEGISTFIISKSNLDLLVKHYSFREYAEFYEQNFTNIPEAEIKGYTLDEPDFSDDKKEEKKKKENKKK